MNLSSSHSVHLLRIAHAERVAAHCARHARSGTPQRGGQRSVAVPGVCCASPDAAVRDADAVHSVQGANWTLSGWLEEDEP